MTDSLSSCPVCNSTTGQIAVAYRLDLELCQCRHCGLVYQAKSYSATKIVAMYDSSYYDYWGVEHFDDLQAIKVKTGLAYLDLLKPYLPQNQLPLRLLDVGCAHGFMLEAAQQIGFDVVGVEISPAATIAQERGFTVYNEPLHELHLPEASFDVITIIDVLEHIPNPLHFMREVYHILKPKGCVLIVTPNVQSWIALVMKDSWPHYKHEHLTYFNPRSLLTLLGCTGFDVEYIKPGFKYLNFNYITGHFQKYTSGWMTTILRYFHFLLPVTLAKRPLRLPTEIIIVARREGDCQNESA